MLHVWMEQNLLLYGMIGAGVLGIFCIAMINHFYNRAIRDLHRITEPRGKWTKEFLNEYQMRKTKEQEINNPEVFVRTQLIRGKVWGITLPKWKQGVGYGALICFLFMMAAVYGTYRYQEVELMRYQYVLVGAGIFALLLIMKQFMGFFAKEDIIMDGLMDYMENMSVRPGTSQADVAMQEAAQEKTKEELIDRVTKGIRQTAASESKFSHMLTPEEEHIMRDVIREYLT
ncbi:MAG: hypothetical protein EOM40_11760 [Clostridia bacterium]|nr:hypothetical protein [Clostridia bacterium]NCC43701.1 hypothetical protein [Clostridia bacterium]